MTEYGNHPVKSLLLLLMLVLTGALAMGALSVAVALVVAGGTIDFTEVENLLSGSAADSGFIKIVQAGSSIGTFVLPALLLGVFEKRRYTYLDFHAPVNPMLWLLIIAILFFAMPFFDQVIKLNEQLRLPEALSGLENWMKTKEAEQQRLILLLFADTTYWGLFTNLIVVAVIAAIGEEFLFRGCLQHILTRWFGNPHAAVWIAAIIFSAIHLQFYGFLPRLLLGAFFGYLLLWGKNIWLPVLAHFVNNAIATISAFYLLRQGKSLDDVNLSDEIPGYLYVVSMVITVVLLYQYYRTATTPNTRRHGKALD